MLADKTTRADPERAKHQTDQTRPDQDICVVAGKTPRAEPGRGKDQTEPDQTGRDQTRPDQDICLQSRPPEQTQRELEIRKSQTRPDKTSQEPDHIEADPD